MSKFSFDITTSVDFYKKLLADYAEFLKDKTSSRTALNCAMTAWHLSDWIFNEYGSFIGYSKIKEFQKHLEIQCPSLRIMNDLANGTKHHSLTRQQPIVEETKFHKGAFSSDFSRDFDISSLRIKLKDSENKIYFENEIKTVVRFWKEYFTTIIKIDLQAIE